MGLEVIFYNILLKDKAKHFFEIVGWDGRAVVVKFFVCFAYRCNTLLLECRFLSRVEVEGPGNIKK